MSNTSRTVRSISEKPGVDDQMTDNRPPFLDVAKRALVKHYPGAIGAFVAGSITRGEGTPTSDIDIAVLFDDTFEDVHRNSVVEEGWPIEFFVHNPQSLNYYFDKDRQRGMCIMPQMVATGIIILEDHPALDIQRKKARKVIEAGPPALDSDDLNLRRYWLSDLIDDLKGADDTAKRNAILALLHDRLGDFHLRAAGQWSGFGKALLRCLKNEDPIYTDRFERVFADAFEGKDTKGVLDLAEETLRPHGGPMWEGYRSAAPDDWKTFEGEA